MKLPFLQFFPDDYLRDTRALSLAAKGGWTDILCMLHGAQNRGSMTLPMLGWARIMGASVDQAEAVIGELLVMKVADIERNSNGNVTIICRRMVRELITREQTRLRVQSHRNKRRNDARNAPCNENVTPKKTEDRRQKTEANNTTEARSAAAPLIIPLLLNVPEFLGPWAQWEGIRRKGKKPKSSWPDYFGKQLAWLEPFGLQTAIDIVAASARNEWQGLFPPKGAQRATSAKPRIEKDAPDAASVALGTQQRASF